MSKILHIRKFNHPQRRFPWFSLLSSRPRTELAPAFYVEFLNVGSRAVYAVKTSAHGAKPTLCLQTGDFENGGRSFSWVSTSRRNRTIKWPIISFRKFIRGSGKHLKILPRLHVFVWIRMRMNLQPDQERNVWLDHLKNSLAMLLSYTEHFVQYRFGERYTSHLLLPQ